MERPRHVAITMDGNRRWAEAKGLTTFEGHLAGARRIEPIVQEAGESGIEHLSLFAFSTENFERSADEQVNIMKVFRHMLHDPVVDRFKEQGIRIKILGDYGRFPSDIVEDIDNLEKGSEANTKMTVNFALGYGGQDEVLRATNKLLKMGVTYITRELLESQLDTAGQPNVDFMIRTGGSPRTSGFLMWQSVYSDLYFTDTLWPDFAPQDLQCALSEYDPQNRRFGR